MQKTKLEIIDETVEYYSNYKRGIASDGSCSYLTKDGNMCAVGRCLINPTISMGGTAGLFKVNSKVVELEDYLKPEYKGHKTIFWQDLQWFHDDSDNWNDHKLTETGLTRLKYLKETYGTKSIIQIA